MKLEKQIMLSIKQRLDIYEMVGQVIWKTRLNSGRIKTYFGSHIKLCDKGTWDWVAVFRNRENNLSLLFIECKSNTGKLRDDQILFQKKYNKKDVYFLVVKEPKELNDFIDKYSKDFVNLLPKSLEEI